MNAGNIESTVRPMNRMYYAVFVALLFLIAIGAYYLGSQRGYQEGRVLLASELLNSQGSAVAFCKEVLFREGKSKPALTAEQHMERWRSLARWAALDYVLLETYLNNSGKSELTKGKIHGAVSKLILLTPREDKEGPYQYKKNHPLNVGRLADQALLDDFVRRHPPIE